MEPEVGQVIDGYRFKGGDPAQESSWERVEARGARLLPRARATGDRRSEEAYYRTRRTSEDPAVAQASEGVTAARRAEGLLRRQEAQGEGTGGIYGVPIIGPVAGYLDPEIRELNALQSRQARLERQPGEGAISDFDAAQFVAMTYGADKPMETNRALIQAQRVANDARLQKREFDEWYWNTYGTTTGAQEAWRVYAQENPIFDPNSQRAGEARLNPDRQNWREYFTGQTGLDTQAELDARAMQGPDVVGPTGPNGLPTYPTITERTANIRDIKTPGEGIAVQWLVDNGVDTERFQNDTDYAQAEMSRLGYEPINGEWVNKYGQSAPIDKSKAPASESVAPAPASDQGAIDQRRSESGLARRVDAFVRGAADTATFGLADEISAGLNTVLPLERGSVGGWGQGFGPAYEQNLALARGIDRADAEQMPITRGAGQIAGVIGGGVGAARLAPQALRIAPRVAGATRMANAGRIAANTGRVAAGGAATGGAYGFGSSEGGVQERAGNALEGAAIGAVAAPVAGAVGNALARPVGRLVERVVSRPNALTTGIDRFVRRFNPNTNALAARADELSAMEIQPTFVDLMDEGQRGLTRALATRQTPARQAVRDFAEGRAEGLQDRIATQARRTISPETRSPLELREMAARQAREQAAPLYEQAYAQPMQVSDEIKSLLATPAGQAALGRAQRIAANERRPFDIENMDMQTLDYAKRGLDDVLEGYRDPVTGRLNLDTEGRAVEAVRQAFRTELDRLNPAYAAARQAYGDSASLQGATDLGEQFLTMEADQFARQAGRLNPAERMVAQAGARRAVERAAGTQGAAPGVAQRLASGREQGMRSQALLGENAGAMQQAMQAEREGLMAARSINPAQGSVTASAMSDQMQTLGNVGQTIGSALTGNLRGTVGGLARLVRLGYSDKEAEALVTAAIDPTRTREVIDLLAARMSRGEARNLVRSLRYMAGQQSGAQAARND